MPPEAIDPFDLYRIFIGDAPWWFGLEIVARTVFMYVYTLVMIRAMGPRTLGQLSLIEFLLVIGIGSAVGDPMLYPDVPLLHGMIVVTVVVWLNRGVIHMINNHERFERFVEGGPRQLVTNGRIHPDRLEDASLNREKLFELLRAQGVRHLGEVDHAFLEQSGSLSLYRKDLAQIEAGLRVMPPWDIEEPIHWQAGEEADGPDQVGCERCGKIIAPPDGPLPPCPRCDGTSWVDAITPGLSRP